MKAGWRHLIGPDTSRYCVIIGWNHWVTTPALKSQIKLPKAPKGHFFNFAVSLYHNGGFHARKGWRQQYKDRFFLCLPSNNVNLWPRVLHSEWRGEREMFRDAQPGGEGWLEPEELLRRDPRHVLSEDQQDGHGPRSPEPAGGGPRHGRHQPSPPGGYREVRMFTAARPIDYEMQIP